MHSPGDGGLHNTVHRSKIKTLMAKTFIIFATGIQYFHLLPSHVVQA